MAVLLLTACTDKQQQQERPKEADISIVYTSDVHGMLLPSRDSIPGEITLANVKTYVDQLRQENPNGLLLMDCGDFMQGNDLTYYYSYAEPHAQHIAPLVAKEIGYNTFGFGANDLEVGAQMLWNMLEPQFQNIDFLCANAVLTASGRPICKPYAVYTIKGIRIAVLGMVTPNMEQLIPRALWPGLEFEDMVQCAKKWVPLIREQEKPDLLVGLFHSGVSYNDTIQTKDPNGALPAAMQVPGLDILLLGHEHRYVQGAVKNAEGDSVPYIEIRSHAKQIGQVDVHFTLQQDGTMKHELKVYPVEMSQMAADQTFANKFTDNWRIVGDYLDKKLGELKNEIDPTDALVGPSAYMDLINDIQREISGTDISLTNYISRSRIVPAGDISMSTLFSLYRYVNQLYVVKLTGEEIHQYLEWAAAIQFNQMTSPNDHLIDFVLDDNGKVKMSDFGPELNHPEFDWSTAGGIRYTIDVSKPQGERVAIHSMADGSPFDVEATYRVAVNAHQAIGGGGYFPYMGFDEEKLKERIESTLSTDARMLFANYIKMHPEVTAVCHNDWNIIPAQWVKVASERDRKIFNH